MAVSVMMQVRVVLPPVRDPGSCMRTSLARADAQHAPQEVCMHMPVSQGMKRAEGAPVQLAPAHSCRGAPGQQALCMLGGPLLHIAGVRFQHKLIMQLQQGLVPHRQAEEGLRANAGQGRTKRRAGQQRAGCGQAV